MLPEPLPMLDAGVISVRRRDSVAAGTQLSPTIHMAGPIINGEERGSCE